MTRPAGAGSPSAEGHSIVDEEVSVPIGRAAASLGVSERTLRYYEELGLVEPAEHSPGGCRRYGSSELARVRRIKELREVMGFDLEEIRTIVANEDRLEALRAEYRAGSLAAGRQAELLREALALQEDLRARVTAKADQLQALLDELDGRIARTRSLAAELEALTGS